MRCPCFTAALLLLLPTVARPDQLFLDSRWALGGPLAFSAGLESEEARFFWACKDCAKAVERPDAGAVSFGMWTPWLRAGPLARAGLFRVAYNPLGFSPQSDVFSETIGLPLERSLDGGRQGLLLMPLPDVLGLYCMDEGQGSPAYGCFAGILSPEGSGFEALLSFSEPPAESAGEDWFSSRAPFPGGRLLVAATRFRLSIPGASLAAALGTSRGERVSPGGFWQLRASLHSKGAYATLLAAGMDGLYRTPRGTGFEEAWLLGAAGGLSLPAGSASIRYSLVVDQPEPVPHPFRETREELQLRIDRVIAQVGAWEISGIVNLEKRISSDPEGARDDSSRCAVALRGAGRKTEIVAGVELLEPDGLAIFAMASIRGRGRGPRLTLDSRWEARLRESPELTELLTLRLPGADRSFRVQAGIQGLPLENPSAGLPECIKLEVSWSVSASPVPGQDHLALQ